MGVEYGTQVGHSGHVISNSSALNEGAVGIAEQPSHIMHYSMGQENTEYARGLGSGVIDQVVFCLVKFSIKFEYIIFLVWLSHTCFLYIVADG